MGLLWIFPHRKIQLKYLQQDIFYRGDDSLAVKSQC